CDVLVQSTTQNAQITATFLQYALAITGVTCNLIPGPTLPVIGQTSIGRMAVTVQPPGGVGTYITDPANQAGESCGAWSGPTGLFGISCVRGSSDQPTQATMQFTENNLIGGTPPFAFPITIGTLVQLS